MPNEIATRGLCMTCNNSASCYYLKSRGPALFCDLFDDFVPPQSQFSFTLPAESPQLNEMAFAGLCMNCDNRMTCHHPKPETGIWHCEEYV